MPTHASTAKRMRSDKKRRLRNRMIKSRVKAAHKQVYQDQDKEGALANLPKATSLLDKAASKGVMHRKTASRLKSRMAKKVNAMEAKTAKKTAAEKK
jgi:small subunit ribosomal protein S20